MKSKLQMKMVSRGKHNAELTLTLLRGYALTGLEPQLCNLLYLEDLGVETHKRMTAQSVFKMHLVFRLHSYYIKTISLPRQPKLGKRWYLKEISNHSIRQWIMIITQKSRMMMVMNTIYN